MASLESTVALLAAIVRVHALCSGVCLELKEQMMPWRCTPGSPLAIEHDGASA